jgi:FKBP-type peptidyl-prolyl cis-trans isomerase
MKNTVIILCFFFTAVAVYPRAIMEEANLSDEKSRTSYAFGMVVGADLRQSGFEIDYPAFYEGLKAVMEDLQTKIEKDDAMEIVQTAFERAMARQSAELQVKEAEFLTENASLPGITVTESGLQYEILEEGDGPKPESGDTVLVHYEGTLTDGTVFDSSYRQETPVEFNLDMLLPGWSEGIQLINTGGKICLYIPSGLAYGEYGVGQMIPPFSTLIFTVELLDIITNEEEEEEMNNEE